MSRIDDLIQELCPHGVEYLPLRDVLINFDSKRKPVTKADRRRGCFPYYGANGIQDYVDNFIFDGTYLLVGEDGSVKHADGRPVLNWATGKIWVNNHAHVLQARDDRIELRFAYFYLQTVDISNLVTGGTQPKLNQKNLNKIQIPLPPLEVQREIVRVLDQFTQLEAELEAELEARKKQYAYYRDRLLTFSQNDLDTHTHTPSGLFDSAERGSLSQPEVRWVTLGEAFEYSRMRAENVDEESYVGVENLKQAFGGRVDSSSVPSSTSLREYVEGDILLGNIRPYLRKLWLADRAGGASPDVLVLSMRESFADSLLSRFVFHYLCRDHFFSYLAQHSRGGKMPRGDKQAILKYQIPLPPVCIQERVIEILDRFDVLVNDYSSGLPAEIEARRKQYEYYRDRLLTFSEKTA